MESDVAAWLEDRFGARDERLLTDPDIRDGLVTAREELENPIPELSEQLDEHRATYKQEIRAGAETDDEAERRNRARRAKRAKERYRERRKALVVIAERLAVVLTVEALREFDEVPTADSGARDAVAERFFESPLVDIGDPGEPSIDVAREALELENDPLRPERRDEVPPHPEPMDGDGLDEEEIEVADGVGDDDLDLDLDEEL